MDIHESDYIDDSFLQEIQCDKCPYSFPLYLFSEHELMCDGLNDSDSSSNDAEEEIPNAQAEVENAIPQALEKNTKTPTKEEDVENLIEANLVALAINASEQKETPKEKKDRVFEDLNLYDIQVPEEDIKLENAAVALSSFSGKAKRVEEEKPSFKAPSNILLKGPYSKPHIRNNLTDSDNEDVESLEEFWRRADVKLAQRMRKMDETKVDRKMF